MCNKGMRPRHWEKMSNTAGFDLTPDSGTTLRKVLKLNLEQYMEEFEGISAAATKVSNFTVTLLLKCFGSWGMLSWSCLIFQAFLTFQMIF